MRAAVPVPAVLRPVVEAARTSRAGAVPSRSSWTTRDTAAGQNTASADGESLEATGERGAPEPARTAEPAACAARSAKVLLRPAAKAAEARLLRRRRAAASPKSDEQDESAIAAEPVHERERKSKATHFWWCFLASCCMTFSSIL